MMCDCYGHKCKECDQVIPMHLGDFNTSAGEIDVFCWRHLPNYNVILYHIRDAEDWVKKEHQQAYEREKEFIGKTVAIRPLTENAIDNKLHNHPNLLLEWAESETSGGLSTSELAYVEISKLRTLIDTHEKRVKELTPQAVKELRAEGLAYDAIVRILRMGKITAINIVKESVKEERKCPKCGSTLKWDAVMRHYKCSSCPYLETGSFQT